MNTLPFAPPSARFSDGLMYRFRLRPVARPAVGIGAVRVGAEEFVFDCVFSEPLTAAGARQEGTCITSAGGTLAFGVDDEQGGSAHGVRVFAGLRWDPFIMDAPAALKTIATGQLAFTDPGCDLPGRQERAQHRGRDRLRQAARRRGAGRGGRGDPDPWHAHRPHRTGRAAGGEEPAAGAQAVRPGQSRSRDPRPLQHGGRVPSRGGLPGRLSGAAERQPGLLGRPRRQPGLAGGRGRHASADRADACRLPGRGRGQAVRRARLLPGDRAGHPWRARASDFWWTGP